VARPQGIEGLGMAGPGKTLRSPWILLAIWACFSLPIFQSAQIHVKENVCYFSLYRNLSYIFLHDQFSDFRVLFHHMLNLQVNPLPFSITVRLVSHGLAGGPKPLDFSMESLGSA
jgi:hypothetical protein